MSKNLAKTISNTNFRETDSSCKTLGTEAEVFYKCVDCDESEILYLCPNCKKCGSHQGHKFIEETNVDLVKFCNCGDRTGLLHCKTHPILRYRNGELALINDREELRIFQEKFKIDIELAVKIARINQLKVVERESPEGMIVQKYFKQTNAHNIRDMKMSRIWSVYRKDQERIFVEREHHKERCFLLWHGTKRGNLTSIMQNGFLKPVQNENVRNGAMFGKGIYFSDRVSKSARYSDREGYGLLFLCEVAVGKMYRTGLPRDFDKPPEGFQSIKGVGKRIPDIKGEEKFGQIIVPCGETVDNPRDAIKHSHLIYNEYNIFETDRVLIRFIVAFKHDKMCLIQ